MDHHDEDPDGMMDVEIVNLELDEDEEDALMDGTGDDNEDLEEYQGLLGGSSGGNESLSTQKLREELELEFSPAQKPLYRLGWKCLKFGCIAFALLLLWTFALMVLNSMSKKASHRHHQKQEHQAENTITKDLLYGNRTTNVNYACPAHIGKAPNDKDDIFSLYNTDTKRHSADSGISPEYFMDIRYGSWGITPRERKYINSKWVHWYAEAYESLGLGNNTDTTRTIYESACGTGLTMFVNLELLQEQYNITNIEVHGNEYIAEDVITANHFYDLVQEKNNPVNNNLNIHKGRICHGDSTNLSFVPANAFDIVFTGYIDPVVDPLDLHLSDRKYSLYCHSESSSKRQELMRKEQALVEDWFALWTRQMIRLAKPGGTIIIESISRPKCEVGDWGGVSPEWWKDVAAKKYGWDAVIDTESIVHMEFEPTRKFKGLHDRYNVKMVKLNPSLS